MADQAVEKHGSPSRHATPLSHSPALSGPLAPTGVRHTPGAKPGRPSKPKLLELPLPRPGLPSRQMAAQLDRGRCPARQPPRPRQLSLLPLLSPVDSCPTALTPLNDETFLALAP